MALVFDKPSTRTRVSFETGVFELGGHPLMLRQGELQMARGESPRDVALVLSRMVHAIGIRTGPHETVAELAATQDASIPVINMLTHDHHPCQALADLITLRERFGHLEGLKLAYVGDGNNMAPLTVDRLAAGRCGAGHRGLPPELRCPELASVALPEAGGARRARGLHGRLGEHGRRGRRRAPARAAGPLPDRRRPAGACARRRDRAALPARPPGRGDHRGRALRRALGGLGPGREPPARAEGAARTSYCSPA